MHVKDIRDELGAQTTAMIQGWQHDGFGAYIYAFLSTEINDYGGEASVGNMRSTYITRQPAPTSCSSKKSAISHFRHLLVALVPTLRPSST